MLDSIVILVDTREHEGKNDHILNYFDSKKINWKKYKLDFGDYSFMIPKNEELSIPRDLYFDSKIMIERKANLDELVGNIVKDRNRLKKEFALAPPTKVIVIENASYPDIINGNYMGHYDAKSLYGTLHSFWHEFNIPVFLMEDPKYTGVFIKGYLQYYLRGIIK